MYEKSRILVCNFLVSCDSRAGPVSQTAILEIFSRRYSKYHLKHTLLTALIMPREHKTRHTNNERENERKEIIHDHISLLFTCAIFSISSISRLTIAYMWSNGVAAVCILVTRVVSFTLVNVYEIRDKKKWDFKIIQKMPFIRHYRVKECKPWLFSTFCWIARTRDCRTWRKKLSM